MKIKIQSFMPLFFFIGLFVCKTGFSSVKDLSLKHIEQTINSTITQYQESFKAFQAKLPNNERYLASLRVSCDYDLLNQAIEKAVSKKSPVYLFIQRNGNAIISALSRLIVQVFNAYKDQKVDSLSDLEGMTFSSMVKSLERTGFFVSSNKGIAPLIELNSLEQVLKNNLNYIKNDVKTVHQFSNYITVVTVLDQFLREFFDINYDKDKLVNTLFEQIELSKKGLIAQALDANARFGASVIKAGVNTVGAIGTTLNDTAKVKAFEKDLIEKIELNYKGSMTLYRQNLQEKEQTLADQEKYLSWLFVQFNFNSLYLYEKPEDHWYVEKIVGFLKGKEIKTKINKYIKVFLLGTIRQFEKLIDRGYRYYISNTYNTENGLLNFSISETEKIAYHHLYEFAKDVLSFQMAIKEVDKELTTLKTFSDTIINHIKSDAIKDVSKEKQKAFLEPLYQMAYFFKCIKLENFDYETILSIIKTKMPDVVVPHDPDLNQKYIPFVPLFISRRLPAPVFWIAQFGFGLANVVTEYSLLYVLKKMFPDVSVDTTKVQGQQLQEVGHKIVKKKIKPLLKKGLPESFADPIADKIAVAVLGSVKDQYEEAFSTKPLEKSGLVIPIQEHSNPAQLPINEKTPIPSTSPATGQTGGSEKSIFGRIQDYLASWFAWMWA